MTRSLTFAAALIALVPCLSPAADDVPQEVLRKAGRVVPSPQQLAWQELEYTCFAHFGVNTFTDREWGEGKEDPKIFNPSALDADQWAAACKAAGMKLLILTAKHHDGFCLWPSKLTEHSVKSSPWRDGKGDVVREVADACRKAGLKFGVYLSPWDRHEKTYGSDAYNDYYKKQLRELLTNYGEITEVWWDGACGEGPSGKRQVYDWDGYIRVVRECQPKAVIFGMGPDVRWVGNEDGLARESEWSVLPKKGPGDQTAKDLGNRKYLVGANEFVWYPAECDVSIRPGWFYHADQDAKVKSLMHMLDIYYRSVGRNSVLLVNVPPDRRGLFHENDVARLKELRAVLDETFKTNVAAGKPAKADTAAEGHVAAAAVDGKGDTYWTPAGDAATGTLEIDLGGPATFDRAMLQEMIALGQRVEQFKLEAFDGTEWKEVAKATTIGHKRLLRFPTVTASRVRLVILDSRDTPTIREFGLFKSSPRENERKPDGKTPAAAFDPSTLKPFTEGSPYLGQYETGLYPGEKNEMPEAHRRAGERMAAAIRPLDAAGKPDAEQGRILAVVFGHSNCSMYFSAMERHLRQERASLHPRFEMLNAAIGGNQLPEISQLRGSVWAKAEKMLERPGYSPAQVQVLFLHTTYHGAGNRGNVPPRPFPETMRKMQADLAKVLEHAVKTFPNLKIAYLTCDGFRHYTNFEPHVYQEAFAFKWLIESQIKGEDATAFEGPNCKLPWLTWGPYIWDNAWDRSYFTDGVHPAPKAQQIFVDKYWQHLRSDSVAKPWLLAPKH